MNDDYGWGGCILEGLVIGGLCWLSGRSAEKRTEQRMNQRFNDLIKESEIRHLREQLDEYKKAIEKK